MAFCSDLSVVFDGVIFVLLSFDHDEIKFAWFYELFWMIVEICFALMIGKWGAYFEPRSRVISLSLYSLIDVHFFKTS